MWHARATWAHGLGPWHSLQRTEAPSAPGTQALGKAGAPGSSG